MLEIYEYQQENGNNPYSEWVNKLRDRRGAARIKKRIARLRRDENFGDHKNVGDGVIELREHHGPGYRIYCGRDGDKIVVLLCGGDKSTQENDIEKAQEYWNSYLQET